MQRKLTSFDVLLVGLVLCSLCFIGYFVYSAKPNDHESYMVALLDFSMADDLLTEDFYRLQSGALTNFDALVSDKHLVHEAEHRLSRLPAYLKDNETLDKLIIQLTVQVNQKLNDMEDFKSALAGMRSSLDNLEALAEEVGRSPEGAQLTRPFLSETLSAVMEFVDDPTPRDLERIQGKLDEMNVLLAAQPEVDGTTPLHLFAARTKDVVDYRTRSSELLQAIAAIPVSNTAAELSYTYQYQHQQHRLWNSTALAILLALVIIAFAVLTYMTLRYARRHEIAVEAKQKSLDVALKDARDQSATLRRGEADGAVMLAEERLVTLLRNTFEMVSIISREENYIFLSPAVERVLGLPQKELIGKSVYEGIHGDDIIRVKDYFAQAQKELQTEQTISYRLMDAFGKWHVVETFASNQYTNPAIRGMVLNTRRLDVVADD